MTSRLLIFALIAVSLVPASASAGSTGFFAGLDLSGGTAFGSSKATDGGAPWTGGSVISHLKFGNTAGIGGHAGYRFDPAWSGFVSYQYVRGDVGWDAAFPMFGVASNFRGTAMSAAISASRR